MIWSSGHVINTQKEFEKSLVAPKGWTMIGRRQLLENVPVGRSLSDQFTARALIGKLA